MKLFPLLALLCLTVTSVFAEDPSTFEVGAFTFQRPADWSWVPVNSPMRKAQLKVPGADPAASADIAFFFFGENSGDVESNIKRWLSQFEGKADAQKIAHQEIGSTKITYVTTEGTYHSGMPGGPTTPLSDYGLLGAILENPTGSVFVKMTGPASVVKSKQDQFTAFVDGAAKGLK